MGLSHHLQETDRENTVQIGIRERDVMLVEYLVHSLCIATMTDVNNDVALKERVVQLIQLDEDRFITGFHQRVEKD